MLPNSITIWTLTASYLTKTEKKPNMAITLTLIAFHTNQLNSLPNKLLQGAHEIDCFHKFQQQTQKQKIRIIES